MKKSIAIIFLSALLFLSVTGCAEGDDFLNEIFTLFEVPQESYIESESPPDSLGSAFESEPSASENESSTDEGEDETNFSESESEETSASESEDESDTDESDSESFPDENDSDSGSSSAESGSDEPIFCDHQYVLIGNDQPTCEFDGYNEYACIKCDDRYKEIIEALGHDYVPNEQPICTEGRLIKYTCSRCGDWYEQIVESKAHDLGDWEYDEDNHYKICTVCGATVETNAHDIIDGVCSVCGYVRPQATGFSSRLPAQSEGG